MASNVSYISTYDPEVKVTLLEYTDGNPIYKGTHTVFDAGVGDTGWLITKFTWSGDDVTKMQTISGIWSGRVGLGWT